MKWGGDTGKPIETYRIHKKSICIGCNQKHGECDSVDDIWERIDEYHLSCPYTRVEGDQFEKQNVLKGESKAE